MYEQYVGQKVNNWLILELIPEKPHKLFICECVCGLKKELKAYRVIHNHTKQCKPCADKKLTKHGQSLRSNSNPTPTYRVWNGLRNRCNNPNNKDFVHYGQRGITVCERWNSFENFLGDMGEKPVKLSLDRINNDGPYSPENCRWATYSQQNSNQRRRKRKVTI